MADPTASKAPMSQRAPCGRPTPRWSVAGGGQPGLPASMAGLPPLSAMVFVGPPLAASGSSCGLVPCLSPAELKAQSAELSMLYPAEMNEPRQSSAPAVAALPATMLSWTVKASPGPLAMPPPEAAELPDRVTDDVVTSSGLAFGAAAAGWPGWGSMARGTVWRTRH